MQKSIVALLVILLANNVFVDATDKNNRPPQIPFRFPFFITWLLERSKQQQKILLRRQAMKKKICNEPRISVRKWHEQKAAKKVADCEEKLNKALGFVLPDSKKITFDEIFIERNKKEYPCNKLPYELEQMLQERLKQLGYPDIPNIVENPEKKSGMAYNPSLD